MPLYMDGHDISDATLEEVTTAHQNDLEIQARHHCKMLTYWYNEARGVAFCLVEAPSSASVRNMHREVHGLIPNQIIEVDTSTVAQFLGRVTDPEGNDDILLQARIGIGAGEPVQDGDALFGSTVNHTSRICDCGEAGQIVAARVICELCMGKDVNFKSLGPRKLKGFDDPTDLELVEWFS